MSRPPPPTCKTRNWPACNDALKRRGSLTIWFDPAMSREAAPTGRRGRQPVCSDAAIPACLTMKVLLGLNTAGHALVKVNPGRARRFAQAAGYRAKADRVDAAMLARMGMALDLDATPVRSDSMHGNRELQVARLGLVRDRTACRNRLQAARNKLVPAQFRARLRQVENQIEQIDAELKRLVAADPALAHRFGILLFIPGIGPVAAVAMIVERPELGRLGGKQAASPAGLAPITRESGKWKGRSRIGGGRRRLRRALYLPALVTIRHNAEFAQVYRTL